MEIKDEGTGNSCRFEADGFEAGASLTIRGNDNTIEIGADIDMRAPKIFIEGNGNVIRMAADPGEVASPAGIPTRPFLLQRDDRAPAIDILGNCNTIETGRHVQIYSSLIQLVGSDNLMRIGSWVRAHLRVDFQTSRATFELGDETTSVALQASLHEPGTMRIGKDCQISADIYLTVSDTHPIVDLTTGERINKAGDVIIGDHVWLGFKSTVLKGCTIGSGSTIGTCAVVTGDIPENCVAVGNPAKVVRENVTWAREFSDAETTP